MVYKPWVKNPSMFWGFSDVTYQVICDTWGRFVEEACNSITVILHILYFNMDSFVQHRNSLQNSEHAKDMDTPRHGSDRSSGDIFIERENNSNLVVESETNNGEFVLR